VRVLLEIVGLLAVVWLLAWAVDKLVGWLVRR
jgi:hypothetical protein